MKTTSIGRQYDNSTIYSAVLHPLHANFPDDSTDAQVQDYLDMLIAAGFTGVSMWIYANQWYEAKTRYVSFCNQIKNAGLSLMLGHYIAPGTTGITDYSDPVTGYKAVYMPYVRDQVSALNPHHYAVTIETDTQTSRMGIAISNSEWVDWTTDAAAEVNAYSPITQVIATARSRGSAELERLILFAAISGVDICGMHPYGNGIQSAEVDETIKTIRNTYGKETWFCEGFADTPLTTLETDYPVLADRIVAIEDHSKKTADYCRINNIGWANLFYGHFLVSWDKDSEVWSAAVENEDRTSLFTLWQDITSSSRDDQHVYNVNWGPYE